MNSEIDSAVKAVMEKGGPSLDRKTANFPSQRVNKGMGDWCRDMYAWGRRVRRDILVMESHLQKLGIDSKDFYGDPGDPPPPEEDAT